MVGIYCEGHATCPFYKFWISDAKDKEELYENGFIQLRPIETHFREENELYVCRALEHCGSSADKAERFLASLSSPLPFFNGHDSRPNPIPQECSVLATLTNLNEIKSMLEARKK